MPDVANNTESMPVLFIGHGSPLNAIENNEFSAAWTSITKRLPRPHAILCISAHWETIGTCVTAMEQPRTIHDFYGFPEELYQVRYPAPGDPALAQCVQQTVHSTHIQTDADWGLDHGTWSVLRQMFPKADIPVIQLSLDRTVTPMHHYELGRELKTLRKNGILIIGSGNIVHNLSLLARMPGAYDWALDFDALVKALIIAGDHDAIIHYPQLGKNAHMAVPTAEHFLPLLYVLALQEKEDNVTFFAEAITLGSISMRCLLLQ